jgi:hypothetical protein
MARHVAIKMHVQVGADHTVKLPAEVPVGPADVIVLVEDAANGRSERSLLGLFADEPEVVDEAMVHVRTHRQNGRSPPVPLTIENWRLG